MAVVHCRLFAIMAARSPVAVILRRGPTAWYQVIRWDTAKDVFDDGAWFRGRIYEDRCDVSPDGALLLYFSHGGATRAAYTHAWTAVSRVPWLHAHALWPWGTTYGGGGRFTGDRALVLRGGCRGPHPDHLPAGLDVEIGNPPCHASTGEVEGAQWCGRDHMNALVFAREGRLYRRLGGRDQELADFDGRTPDPVEAPASAKRPLGRR